MHPLARFGILELPLRYLLTIGIGVVLALVVLAFARVGLAEIDLRGQRQSLERDITNLQTENQALHAKVEYLQTDDAIEKLARDELGWTKPGDTAIIVVRPVPTPTVGAAAPAGSR